MGVVSDPGRPPSTATGRTNQALAVASRVAILNHLRSERQALGVREIAAAMGLHHNTVRFHLDLLVTAGLVKRYQEPPRGPGRPRVAYEAIPASELEAAAEPQPHRGDHLLAQILASYLAGTAEDPSAAATTAGREWGRYLVSEPKPFERVDAEAAVDQVLSFLEELGFAPTSHTDNGDITIELHRCPFREVAEAHPEVACSVHLGLIQGALAALRAPVEGTSLEPFVTPRLCRAHLRPQ